MMEKLPLVKYCKLSNFQLFANFRNSPLSLLHHPDMHALIRQKGFSSSTFLYFFPRVVFPFFVVVTPDCIFFFCFVFFFMFFSVFIAIGNFPALTSLLSIDDLTGSTVIPLIAHEAGKKHRNTEIQEYRNTELEIQKYTNTKIKNTQIHKYLTRSTVIP